MSVLSICIVSAVGRGMGSPIPSRKEGAWTREGPKFVDGGLVDNGSGDVFVLEP